MCTSTNILLKNSFSHSSRTYISNRTVAFSPRGFFNAPDLAPFSLSSFLVHRGFLLGTLSLT
jgi:hypothetical protein